jgi:hypothetical protein
VAYAKEDQLRLGNIPLPTNGSATRAVNLAADEIDAALGFKYKTPIRATGATCRPVELLMQQINIFLASGRLIAELLAGKEDLALNAFAKGMIDEAWKTLNAIIAGQIVLEGVPPANTDLIVSNAPIIDNEDDASGVTAFFDKFGSPNERVLQNVWPYAGQCPPWWRG